MTSNNKRREFLKGVAATGAVAAASTIAALAIAQDVKELKMVTSWPKNFPGLGTALERFAQRLETIRSFEQKSLRKFYEFS